MNNNELAQLENLIRKFLTTNNIKENITIDIYYEFGGMKIDFCDIGEDIIETKYLIEELEDENRELENQNTRLENHIENLRDEIDMKKAEIEVLENQIEKKDYRIDELCEKIFNLEEKINKRKWW